MDYTVIGDTVKVASRLQRLAKEVYCKILFNDGIYESVKDVFPCEHIGEQYVKGRAEPLTVYGIGDDWIRSQSTDQGGSRKTIPLVVEDMPRRVSARENTTSRRAPAPVASGSHFEHR